MIRVLSVTGGRTELSLSLKKKKKKEYFYIFSFYLSESNLSVVGVTLTTAELVDAELAVDGLTFAFTNAPIPLVVLAGRIFFLGDG
jgi:hypothetical protein